MAFLAGARQCLTRAYFHRHRIFIRFTYHLCRNYSYSWKRFRISLSSLGRENFSFWPFSYLFSSIPWKEVCPHLHISPLISSPIAMGYGLCPYQCTFFLHPCLFLSASCDFLCILLLRCSRRSWYISTKPKMKRRYTYCFNSKIRS